MCRRCELPVSDPFYVPVGRWGHFWSTCIVPALLVAVLLIPVVLVLRADPEVAQGATLSDWLRDSTPAAVSLVLGG